MNMGTVRRLELTRHPFRCSLLAELCKFGPDFKVIARGERSRLKRHSYSEAINLLYSSFSFDVVGLSTAYRFLSLVPLQRLNQIRSLQISQLETPVAYRFLERVPKEWYPSTEKQWIRVCSILRAAESLRTLKITFSELSWELPCSAEQEEKMLAYLVGIQVPRADFLLQFPWVYESDFIERISESTCTVQRGRVPPFGKFGRKRRRREIARPSACGIVVGWVCQITAIIVCCPCIAIYGSVGKLKEVAGLENFQDGPH